MARHTYNRKGQPILGVFIDAIGWHQTLAKLIKWGISKQSKYVCQCNVDVLIRTTRDEHYRHIISNSDLANPDGMPIVWALRKKGFKNQERISGPELMIKLCRLSEQNNVSVFFYGSTPETLDKIKSKLKHEFKNLKLAGSHSPPFRQLTVHENDEIINLISSSGAGIIFVGIGCPKQEIWMHQNRNRVNAVMIGVGAAFDFYAGTVKRAPFWIQEIGMEWLFRLVMEPKRLWKRYFYGNHSFLLKIIPDILKYRYRPKLPDSY